MAKNRVLIVGAFNRNLMLAQDILSLDYEVDYLDLSNALGRWPAEDIEGPFGFFRSEELSSSDYDLILSGDSFYEAMNGFTFYLKTGPLEMKGPLSSYLLNKKPWIKEIETDWIKCFSNLYGSCLYDENQCSIEYKKNRIPLDGTFNYKLPSRVGFQKQIEYLKSKGVRVWQDTKILDISISASPLVSVEMQGERQGLQNYDQLIWCLTSEETSHYSEKLFQTLFASKRVEPALCWLRYRVRIDVTPEFREIPQHMVIINDLLAPWTHENQIVCIKTASAELIDLWVLQSSVQRFNKDYIQFQSQKILEVFRKKFPNSEPKISDFPQEYLYSFKELGAPRLPVFFDSIKSSKLHIKSNKVFFNSPEQWTHYFNTEVKQSYQNILKELKNLQIKSQKKEKAL